MESRKKIFKNFIFSVVGQALMIVIGLVLPRLYIVSYGSEVNGLLNSLNQFIVYLSLFEAGIGAMTLQALYAPIAKKNWNNVNKVLAATNKYYKRAGRWYFLSLLLLAVVYPFVVKSELSKVSIMLAAIFNGLGNVIMFYCQGKYKLLLQAEGKNYIITNLTTVIFILTSLAKVLLIQLGMDFVAVLFASLVIGLSQVFYIEWYIRKNYPQLNLKVEPDYDSLSQKNYTLIHQLSSLIFNNTDALVLTLFCGLKVVSVYSMYKMIISQLEKVLTILSDAVSFAMGQTFQVDKEQFKKMIDTFEILYSSVSFCLFSVALYLFVPFMKLYTVGVSDIEYADTKLALLFVSAALLTAMRLPMLLTINYAGHFKMTTPQTIAESVINIVVSVLSVFKFGIYGVLIGTIVALLYRTNDVILYSNRLILKRSAKKTYKIHIINLIVMLMVELLFAKIFPQTIANYFELLVAGAISVVVAGISFLGIQLLANKEEYDFLHKQIKMKMAARKV